MPPEQPAARQECPHASKRKVGASDPHALGTSRGRTRRSRALGTTVVMLHRQLSASALGIRIGTDRQHPSRRKNRKTRPSDLLSPPSPAQAERSIHGQSGSQENQGPFSEYLHFSGAEQPGTASSCQPYLVIQKLHSSLLLAVVAIRLRDANTLLIYTSYTDTLSLTHTSRGTLTFNQAAGHIPTAATHTSLYCAGVAVPEHKALVALPLHVSWKPRDPDLPHRPRWEASCARTAEPSSTHAPLGKHPSK